MSCILYISNIAFNIIIFQIKYTISIDIILKYMLYILYKSYVYIYIFIIYIYIYIYIIYFLNIEIS